MAQAFDIELTFDNTFPDDTDDVKFSPEQKARVTEACDRWKAVWASDDFKTQVLNTRFGHTDDDDDTIYQKIMAANPKHMNFALTNDGNGSETAVTDVPSGITKLHSSWISADGSSINDLVNTVSHEYTHTSEGGEYTHAYFQRLFGKNAVPIVVGNITQEIAEKMFPDPATNG